MKFIYLYTFALYLEEVRCIADDQNYDEIKINFIPLQRNYKQIVNMKLLEGKVALVTGGSRGIGRAIAIKFAEQGAIVAFTYRKGVDEAAEVVAQIEAAGGRAKSYMADAADYEQAEQVVKNVVSEFGRLDVLVNNAGVTKDSLLMRMPEQSWDFVVNTNLKSAFNYTHAAVPVMARQRGGSIINMSSVVGVSGNAGQCNYAASKGGLIAFTKSIAKEMGSRGIRANSIAPGFIESDMTAELPEAVRAEFVKHIPLARAGQTDDVANVALFLAGDLSSYVTGQTIACCGGMNM